MSTTFALDCIKDPLVTPLLALLKDAVNADLRELMAQTVMPGGVEAVDAVARVEPREIDLLIEGNAALPVLAAFRTRTRTKQVTMANKDHFITLQFRYMTPSCAVGKLSERWPLLHAVWESIIATLEQGKHAAHRDGADVFGELAITWVNFETASKRELYAEKGAFAYPAFIGELEVRTRMQPGSVQATYPVTSMHAKIYTEQDALPAPRTPDVQVIAYTAIGQKARDAEPADEEQELGAA